MKKWKEEIMLLGVTFEGILFGCFEDIFLVRYLKFIDFIT
jgi:hypothetical protein